MKNEITRPDGSVFTPIDNYQALKINPQDIRPVRSEIPTLEPYRVNPKETPIYKELKQTNDKISSQTMFHKFAFSEYKSGRDQKTKQAKKDIWVDFGFTLLGGAILLLVEWIFSIITRLLSSVK